MALRPEIKGPWVKALRSGEYEQCEGHLESGHDSPRYCCLGVLLVVLGNTERVYDATVPANGYDSAVDGEELSGEMCDYIGLAQNEMHTLASMNDGVGGLDKKDFVQIADHIEKDL